MQLRTRILLPLAAVGAVACGGQQATEPPVEPPTETVTNDNVTADDSPALEAPEFTVNYDYIHRTTLENGLDVVVVERPGVPIVTIEIAVHNGAFTEPPELNGLSHLYEHMFFKSNETFADQEAYMARQRELGMVWNGTTGSERVNYFFTLQSHNLRNGLQFMADAIRTPRFLEEELVREREVVLGEYDRNEANPYYYLWDGMDELLWYAFPSRKDSLGDRETISTATVEQMRWMQETYYIPNNSLIVLAGDVTADEGFALAEELLGEWEAGPDPFIDNPVPEHPPLEADVVSVIEQDVQVTAIQFGWHGPDTRSDIDATYAADVFSFVLSQDASGFQQRLVESGLALSVSLGYSTQRYVGPITMTAVCLPGQEQAVIDAVQAEIALFAEPDYFTDEQMQTAQNLLAVGDIYGQQDTDGLSHTLTYWWASADIDYYLTYVEELASVEREDIINYVQTYIHDQPMAAILLSNPSNIAGQQITDEWLLGAISGDDQ